MKFVFTDKHKEKFEGDGYVVVENLFDDVICDELKDECSRIVDNIDVTQEGLHQFSTDKGDNCEQLKEDYFLTSGDKIRYFWEPKAIDENGRLNRDKMLSLNKIGHALHALNPVFGRATFDEKIKQIFRKLNYIRPVVPQSMYIFKAPNIGGEVNRHIDATYLYTTPLALTGIWIALEDTTVNNGCLQFVPGSHKSTEVTLRLKRDYQQGGRVTTKHEGALDNYELVDYKPVEIKKGSALLIDGKVHHYSEANQSNNSRHVYTFHAVESYNVEWDRLNWLQPTEKLPFTPLYDDSNKIKH